MSATIELSKEQIIDLIKPVIEPETGQSLVELGMVKDAAVDGRDVTVHVELLTPVSPHRERIADEIRAALAAIPDLGDVSFQWTLARARQQRRPHRRAADQGRQEHDRRRLRQGRRRQDRPSRSTWPSRWPQAGAKVGLLDADVYGPSIPLMMGVHDKPLMRNSKIVPLEAHGVHLMSIGFILDPEKALIWRGPLVAQLITQFLNDVDWGDLDYLIIDLPPGTGDVQLTLVQKIPISGAVIVTTPQDVALADAVKGLKMFQEVKTPILGIVENMSGFVCPDCGKTHDIFGSGGGERGWPRRTTSTCSGRSRSSPPCATAATPAARSWPRIRTPPPPWPSSTPRSGSPAA